MHTRCFALNLGRPQLIPPLCQCRLICACLTFRAANPLAQTFLCRTPLSRQQSRKLTQLNFARWMLVLATTSNVVGYLQTIALVSTRAAWDFRAGIYYVCGLRMTTMKQITLSSDSAASEVPCPHTLLNKPQMWNHQRQYGAASSDSESSCSAYASLHMMCKPTRCSERIGSTSLFRRVS